MYCYKVLSIVVLFLLLGAVSLSVYSLVTNTWWVGEFTAKMPVQNVTDEPYVIFVDIHIRAGVQKTCWHLEQTKKNFDHVFNGSFHQSFDSCFDENGKLFQKTRAFIIVALFFICLATLLQLVNIYVGNSGVVKANLISTFLAATFIMTSLIVFDQNISYDTPFINQDMNNIPALVAKSETLNPRDRSFLLMIIKKLYKSRPKIKFTKGGDGFTVLWSAEILLIVSIIFLIMEHILAMRSGDQDYKKELAKKTSSSLLTIDEK